jgi:hypothetical protein
VSASGIGPFTYQWYKNGLLLTGATSNTYSTNKNGSYYCRVKNENILLTSGISVITFNPIIVSQSPSVSNYKPYPYNAVVAADGVELKYEWYKGSVKINNQTSNTISISSDGNYYCKVYNDNSFVNSETISVEFRPIGVGAPSYSSSLNRLSINADGTGTVFYQWQKNQVNIPGANQRELTPSGSGSYRVIVTDQYPHTAVISESITV